MIVKNILLRNFRNYKELRLSLHPSLTLLIGENGSGKTNILESLLFLSNLRSFRCEKDEEMIQKGCDFSCVDAYSEKNHFRLTLHSKGKSLYIDQNSVKKSSEFFGKVNCILFKPEDIYLFDHSPKERRDLLNVEIGKVDSLYLKELLEYEKLLKDKNALLKKEDIDEIYLSLIEERMVKPIVEISKKRNDFVEFVKKRISIYFERLSGLTREINVVYKGNQLLEEEDILTAIQKHRDKEKILGYSLFGPQKDDFSVLIDGYMLSSYASQGQKRMVLIALKLAIFDYIVAKTKATPIILLDDILSELDKDNRYRLFQCIPKNAQTILTTTDEEEIPITNYWKYTVSKGEIYGK